MRSLQDDQIFWIYCHHQVWRTRLQQGSHLLEPPGCASDRICGAIAVSSQGGQPGASGDRRLEGLVPGQDGPGDARHLVGAGDHDLVGVQAPRDQPVHEGGDLVRPLRPVVER